MENAELRQYSVESYDPSTGQQDYIVLESIQISKKGLDYLTTPEDDDVHTHRWVSLGTRFERLQNLGLR